MKYKSICDRCHMESSPHERDDEAYIQLGIEYFFDGERRWKQYGLCDQCCKALEIEIDDHMPNKANTDITAERLLTIIQGIVSNRKDGK